MFDDDDFYDIAKDPRVTGDPGYRLLVDRPENKPRPLLPYSDRSLDIIEQILSGHAEDDHVPYPIPALACREVHAALAGVHLTNDHNEFGRIFNLTKREYLEKPTSSPLLLNPQLASLMLTGLRRINRWQEGEKRLPAIVAAVRAYDYFIKRLFTNFLSLQKLGKLAKDSDQAEGSALKAFVPDEIAKKVLNNYCERALDECLKIFDDIHLERHDKWLMQRALLNGLFPIIFRSCDRPLNAEEVATRVARFVKANDELSPHEHYQRPKNLLKLMLSKVQILVALCDHMNAEQIRLHIVPIVSLLLWASVRDIGLGGAVDQKNYRDLATWLGEWLDFVFRLKDESNRKGWPEALGDEIDELLDRPIERMLDDKGIKAPDTRNVTFNEATRQAFEHIRDRCKRAARSNPVDAHIPRKLRGKALQANGSGWMDICDVTVLDQTTDRDAPRAGARVLTPLMFEPVLDYGQPRDYRYRIKAPNPNGGDPVEYLQLELVKRRPEERHPCRIARVSESSNGWELGLKFE